MFDGFVDDVVDEEDEEATALRAACKAATTGGLVPEPELTTDAVLFARLLLDDVLNGLYAELDVLLFVDDDDAEDGGGKPVTRELDDCD